MMIFLKILKLGKLVDSVLIYLIFKSSVARGSEEAAYAFF